MLVTRLFGTKGNPDVHSFTRRIDGNVADLPALPPGRNVENTHWDTAMGVLRPMMEGANRVVIRILPRPELERWSSRTPALPPIPMRRAS